MKQKINKKGNHSQIHQNQIPEFNLILTNTHNNIKFKPQNAHFIMSQNMSATKKHRRLTPKTTTPS